MTWQREWGENYDTLLALQLSGKSIKAIENRPLIMSGLEIYLDAYRNLLSDRPVGLDYGMIPWSSIINWCHIHNIYDINDIDTTIRYIRALESEDQRISGKRAK